MTESVVNGLDIWIFAGPVKFTANFSVPFRGSLLQIFGIDRFPSLKEIPKLCPHRMT